MQVIKNLPLRRPKPEDTASGIAAVDKKLAKQDRMNPRLWLFSVITQAVIILAALAWLVGAAFRAGESTWHLISKLWS